MKRVLAAALGVVLTSCASTEKSELTRRWSPPTVVWNGAESVTLPMDTISMDGRIVFFTVELSIDGNKRSFIVDSGSSSTLFTSEFARAMNAKISRGQPGVVLGVGWSRTATTIIVDSMDLGFARLNRLEIPAEDIFGILFDRPMIAKDGRPISGIIGVDLLVPLGAAIDLEKSAITFRRTPSRRADPALAMPPAGAGAAPRVGAGH